MFPELTRSDDVVTESWPPLKKDLIRDGVRDATDEVDNFVVLLVCEMVHPLLGRFVGLEPPVAATYHAENWNGGVGVSLLIKFSVPCQFLLPARGKVASKGK